MRIGFFVDVFPAISETFILNQVVGVLERGHEVEIDCIRVGEVAAGIHADVARWTLMNRVRDNRIPRSLLRSAASAALRLANWSWYRPRTAFDAMNPFRYKWRVLSPSRLQLSLPASKEEREFDIVHCHYGPNGQRALALRRLGLLRAPIVITFHGYDLNLLPRRYGRDLYRDLFSEADLFTVGSEFMRRKALALGAPPERVVKLPMGVDLSFFRPPLDRAPTGGFRMLTVARLIEVKGVEFGLRAAAIARSQIPGLRYTIVGDGPLRPSLERLARRLSLDGVVDFKGALSREEIVQEFAAADGFVLPGIVTANGEEEGQSLAVIEAQACGVPVVACNVGGLPESLIDNKTGYLVPARDPNALAAAIVKLASDGPLRSRMGSEGRIFVQDNFDLVTQNAKLISLYESLYPGGATLHATKQPLSQRG